MNTVIVTGASGFIGRHLVNSLQTRLRAHGRVIPLSSQEADLTDRDETFAWFEKLHWRYDCDHIIHLAALYRAGDWPVHHPATQFFVNMSINVNTLEAWKRYFPKAKMTSVLSYCIYPSNDEPHTEDEVYGNEPEEYLFAYGLTKKAQLIGQKAYQKEYNLRSTSVVLPTVYGPGDSFAEDSHVMGALVGKFVRAAQSGAGTVEVWGSGRQEREFLFIDDAIDGIIEAATGARSEMLNLGNGYTHSIQEIADIIAEKSGFKGSILQNEDRFTGVSKRVMDVSRVESELSWKAATSIEDGIQKTIDWYRNQLGTT